MSGIALTRPFLQTRPRLHVTAGFALFLGLSLDLGLLTGCHHNSSNRSIARTTAPPLRNGGTHAGSSGTAARDSGPELAAGDGFFDDTRTSPNFTESGLATWYYAHGHTGSDGHRYDADAPTAAHKTLPLGSTVRVTNVATGQSTLVRITDRGPFYPGRILDLSEVAARQIGLLRPGIAEVRLEAYPHPMADPIGRWCVQTGPFHAVNDALDLKAALLDRYRGARVSEFTGQTGFWVRIDPVTRGRPEATHIADWIGAPDKKTNSFVVRIN